MRFLLLLACAAVLAQQQPPPPYHDPRKDPPQYHGPGREAPEPGGVKEVRIGYFGPHPQDGMWRAALEVVEAANREGGYKGLPFRLVPAWSASPWSDGASLVARLVFREQVWAVLTAGDGGSVHLAGQVAAKALVPLMNAGATDRSIHAASLPWIFSTLPGDTAFAEALAPSCRAPLMLISGTDHDSRAFAGELMRALARRRISAAWQVQIGEQFEAAGVALRVMESRPATLVVAAPAQASGAITRRLREAGFSGAVVGGPAALRRAFREAAGAAAGSVTVAVPAGTRGGEDPAEAAAAESARLLIAGIRKGGLNRARIRDALREDPRWDPSGQSTTRVTARAPADVAP